MAGSTSRARFVIINDIDGPEPKNVCEWVPGNGYCYLDRSGGRAGFDGKMRTGAAATPIEAFGFSWIDGSDGRVAFTQDGQVSATYEDGKPRRWQSHSTSFSYPSRRKAAPSPEVAADTSEPSGP